MIIDDWDDSNMIYAFYY